MPPNRNSWQLEVSKYSMGMGSLLLVVACQFIVRGGRFLRKCATGGEGCDYH